MSRHRAFFCLLGAEVLLLICLAISSEWGRRSRRSYLAENRKVVAALQLTDLALWSEARYTRHPSQADLFAAFQDLPAAIEHFPAGSILAPPRKARP